MINSPFKPKRALISVSDKEGITLLAKTLNEAGVEIIATGKTAKCIKEAQIPCQELSDYTAYPELLNGRVKSLHPMVHAGLLASPEKDADTLKKYHIKTFDLVIINLYPFEETIAKTDASFEEAIENIDIGGPCMIRAAAKNHAHVTVIVKKTDYALLERYIKEKTMPTHWRIHLAQTAFAYTAQYEMAIASYFSTSTTEDLANPLPAALDLKYQKSLDLRYGENPHQKAALYKAIHSPKGSLANAKKIQGKSLSYNNLLDADAALTAIQAFSNDKAACVIIKHGNPCGIAVRETQKEAYLRAYESDPQSAYGGIIAFNQIVEKESAEGILSTQFLEVLIAPAITDEAASVLSQKDNIRILITGTRDKNAKQNWDLKTLDGGLLLQEKDDLIIPFSEFRTVTEKKATSKEMQDLLFAWRAIRSIKSNAIILAKNEASLGIGAGQSSRIMSTRIALWRAQEAGFSSEGAVLASDAFFPFGDTIQIAADQGIRAIIQPGGSIRDKEIIALANELGLIMIFTGYRHFKH